MSIAISDPRVAQRVAPSEALRDSRQPRHLRVVEPARRARRLRLTKVMAVAAIGFVVASMFAVAICQAMLVQNQLRLDRLEQSVTREQARYERNRLRVAQLESPDRIVSAARDKLGMVSPGEVVYLAPDEPVAPDSTATITGSQNASPTGGDPDAAAAAGDDSWEQVKPYLESAP
jgi:cell division protein FtsL